jgi:phosphatidylglycerophosphatase A
MSRAAYRLGLPVWHPAVLVATGCGIGFLPMAPGTWASLAALPCAWVVRSAAGGRSWPVAALALFTFLIGWWAAARISRSAEAPDPGAVVIDEIAGQLLVLCKVGLDLPVYAVAFVLFRLFDVLKPWPVSWVERHVGGGLGIMLDDIAAAICALLLVMLL